MMEPKKMRLCREKGHHMLKMSSSFTNEQFTNAKSLGRKVRKEEKICFYTWMPLPHYSYCLCFASLPDLLQLLAGIEAQAASASHHCWCFTIPEVPNLYSMERNVSEISSLRIKISTPIFALRHRCEFLIGTSEYHCTLGLELFLY